MTGSIYIDSIIASIPILWVFFGMLKLKMPSQVASPIALGVSILLAAAVWGMPADKIPGAVAEGIALGLFPILWVVFGAILVCNVSVRSGYMDRLKIMLSGISDDRRIQVLIIAFAFGGFLEAAAGFGTAVAIPVGMMIAIGFEPIFATVVCLAANTIPVAFGVAGIPVITLAAVTGLPLDALTIYTALQLLPFTIILPLLLVLLVTAKLSGLKGVILLSLASGIVFGAGQTLTAWLVGPELAAFAGSLLTLALILLWCRFRHKGVVTAPRIEGESPSVAPKEALKTWSPYIILLAAIVATRIIPGLRFLSESPFSLEYMFYTGPGGKSTTFALLTNPGTILVISAVIGGLIQGLRLKTILRTAYDTLKQISRTSVTVLSIVSLAKVMGYGGMADTLAAGITAASGRLYPLFAPLIGAFGTFLTGSDTSSNVLFGGLQKQAAVTLHADPSWFAAANASGATAGKMVSPQSIAIASSVTGLKTSESAILKRMLLYSLPFTIILGIIVYIFNK